MQYTGLTPVTFQARRNLKTQSLSHTWTLAGRQSDFLEGVKGVSSN